MAGVAVGAETENQGSVRKSSAEVQLKEQTLLDQSVWAATGIGCICRMDRKTAAVEASAFQPI